MNLVEPLFNVLAIIALVVTGGFLIFFLGDLVLSVCDPNHKTYSQRMKEKAEEKKAEKAKAIEKKEVKLLTHEEEKPVVKQEEKKRSEKEIYDEDDLTYEQFSSLETIDESSAEKEKQELHADNVEPAIENDSLADLRAEEEAFRQERLRIVEERKKQIEEQEKAKKEAKKTEKTSFDSLFIEDDENDDDFSDFNFDNDEETDETNKNDDDFFSFLEEQEEKSEKDVVAEESKTEAVENAEETKEPKEVEIEQETATVVEETKTEEPVVNTDRDVLLAEIASLKNALAQKEEEVKQEKEELEQEKARLNEIIESAKTPVLTKQVRSAHTEEECLSRIEVLKERLKVSEKEFKATKKEYMPLAKISKNLEKDIKKLRRKEALVAKQKVVLYGVNNVADIDPEKAKKLQEDLDLLDGLRLSVQHCEEVMSANKERYPLLEKAYNLLKNEIAGIKDDITEYEELLKTFDSQDAE